MASIPAVRIFNKHNDIVAYEWTLTENDTAEHVEIPFKSDKTFQASGSFGSGSINVEGSLDPDGIVFTDLRGPDSNVISFTSDDAKAILENVFFIRPKTPIGTAASVVAWIMAA